MSSTALETSQAYLVNTMVDNEPDAWNTGTKSHKTSRHVHYMKAIVKPSPRWTVRHIKSVRRMFGLRRGHSAIECPDEALSLAIVKRQQRQTVQHRKQVRRIKSIQWRTMSQVHVIREQRAINLSQVNYL